MKNLRGFLQLLREKKELIDIYEEVDPYLEIAEIHRRVIRDGGPALFFHRVKNSSFPVVTNLFGTDRRVSLAFPSHPEKMMEEMVSLLKNPSQLWSKRSLIKSLLKMGKKKRRSGPILEHKMDPVDLEKLPLLTTWPLDGGPFITLPLVYTEPVDKGPANLGMYRIQRFDKTTTGLHFQIGKGGGFHYFEAEKKGVNLPCNIFLGGAPALILSAIAPLPENLSELLIASLLQGSKLEYTHAEENSYPLLTECEFALVGHSKPHLRRKEGPFGDHYGYYSWIHDFPVFHCEAIYHRKGAIYPATVVGKPYQEDYFIGNFLQKLLSPLFPMVMPGVKDLWSYGETGFHSLAAASVHERYFRESMQSAFRILGEGQLSFSKFLLITDQNINLKDFKKTLTTVLERFQPETDLFIFSNLSLDTLDYTGPALNQGSRGIMLGVGEKRRELPTSLNASHPSFEAEVFCPGCLVVEIRKEVDFDHILTLFSHWPLIVVVDDVKEALSSECAFLWTTFTRFEPASDIHVKFQKIVRHHPVYTGAILIDARMKKGYHPVVEADKQTIDKISASPLLSNLMNHAK